jgi:hypothetical protein
VKELPLGRNLGLRSVSIGCLSVLAYLSIASSPLEAASDSSAMRVAPLPNLHVTPSGWSPVGLGSFEISVPSTWLIEDPGTTCGDRESMIFIDQAPYSTPSGMACPRPANTVDLRAVPNTPLAHSHRVTINSIPASESVSGAESMMIVTVRALGMQLSVEGPVAARVVKTLTHSPYSVVLHSSVSSVPTSWRSVDFGGLRFSAPSSWSIQRSSDWGGCPYNIQSDVLELSTAQTFSAPGCPPPPVTAGYLAAHSGMVLGAGPQVPKPPAGAKCQERNGLRICIDPPPSPDGGFLPGDELKLLTAQIVVPKQRDIVQIEIGLTGSGMTPLQIFDSLRPSR